jgi:hypothetical protein
MNFLISLLGNLSGQVYIYLAVALGGFSAGFYVEHLRFADFESKVALEAQKQIDANTAKKKEQEIINDNVKKTYEANVSNIHYFYSSLHNTSSGSMSYNANATATINGKTVDILLVAEQCAQTTQQLITLQDWINQQLGLDVK